MDFKQLILGYAGGLTTALLGYSIYKTVQNNKGIQKKVRKMDEESLDNQEQYEHLKSEQLARVIKFFGEEKFHKLQNSYVIVFGVGGVGSHVVNMLARSGVKRIKIVDFDRVSLSSLNRHSFAVRQDVGTSKVECIKKYVNKIFQHVKIETVETYVTVENARELVDEKADYIIDCIDNLDAKVELIAVCKEKGVRLMVSGGAGMKNDPTKLQIRDISDCKYDKLIMRIKRQLVKKGIKSGVKVAFSYQQAEKELLPLTEAQQGKPEAFKVFDNYRIRIVPVLGTMPAILGMSIASYVLCDLADEPYSPFQTDYVKSTAISKTYNQLLFDQKKRGVDVKQINIDMEEVSILAKKVFEWKCLVTDRKESNPRLIRWDPKKPATIDNLALMCKESYEKHKKYSSVEEFDYPAEIWQKFKNKSGQAKYLMESGYMMFI